MGYIPQVSGERLIKILKKLGYVVISQRGSHIKLQLLGTKGKHIIIIPNHKTIAKGTLSDIMKKVSIWTNKNIDEIIEMMK